MILNNYWIFVGYMLRDWNIFDNRYDNIGLLDTNGIDFAIPLGIRSDYGSQEPPMRNHMPRVDLHVAVGTSTTAPTAGDYNLGNDISGSLTSYSESVTSSANGSTLTTIAVASGVNTTGNTITISELGIYKLMYGGQYGTGSRVKVYFVRHLLDEPKVVPSGESFSLTFEWIER